MAQEGLHRAEAHWLKFEEKFAELIKEERAAKASKRLLEGRSCSTAAGAGGRLAIAGARAE